MSRLLTVRNLALTGNAASGPRSLVEKLSFSVSEGESLALVGESGSGKSITALAIMGLLPESEISVSDGSIEFGNANLLEMSKRERRKITGSSIAMIFQEPMTSLNPVMRIGDQIIEAIRSHETVSKKAAMSRSADLLKSVRIPEPEMRLRAYPHQMSGGQRQRVMIAMALACQPKLLIADEPTTALDVTIQAQILALLRELQQDLNMAMLFITHDLGVVANIADRVAIVYCGQLAETGSIGDVFSNPSHPYTRGLFDCVPDASKQTDQLVAIPGQLPAAAEPLAACRFAPRCKLADNDCERLQPPAASISQDHQAYCHHAQIQISTGYEIH